MKANTRVSLASDRRVTLPSGKLARFHFGEAGTIRTTDDFGYATVKLDSGPTIIVHKDSLYDANHPLGYNQPGCYYYGR